MSIAVGAWKTATVALDGTTSGAIDLGGNCDFVQVVIPTITSGTVALQVSTDGTTYYTLGSSITTATGTGNYATEFRLGGYQFIKIVCSVAQGAARSFLVRGRRV